jgi:ferritin
MITAKMQEALNAHVTAEISSAYLYLSMSAYCESKVLKGFGHWFRVQYQEESTHAIKMMDYLLTRGGQVKLGAIEAPPAEFGTMLQVFEATLQHERKVTAAVHKLYEVAVAEGDTAARVFLEWYVAEQVEEEANVSDWVEKLKMIGDRSGTVLYLDKEARKRGQS